MALLILFAVVVFGITRTTLSQNFYVAAPNTFRVDTEETVGVVVEGNNGGMVRVFVQDHPGKIKNISEVMFPTRVGIPELINIRLDSADFPPNFFNDPGSQQFVSLTVHSDSFTKEIVIPISTQSGYVFLQTDKPIYTPNQRVHMRMISLSEEISPSDKVYQLQIKNPDGIIVEKKLFNQKAEQQRKAFITHIYKFPSYPVLGVWSVVVLFGYDLQQNSTIRFKLEEYVLPTFTVELKTRDVILPSAQTISFGVVAKIAVHLFGILLMTSSRIY